LILNVDLDLVCNSAPESDWELSEFQSIPLLRRAIQTAPDPAEGPVDRFVIKLVRIPDGRYVLDHESSACGVSPAEIKKDRAREDGHNPIVLLRVDRKV